MYIFCECFFFFFLQRKFQYNIRSFVVLVDFVGVRPECKISIWAENELHIYFIAENPLVYKANNKLYYYSRVRRI